MNLLITALRYSGAAWLWREVVQRRKVTFLLFHDMTAADAERNLLYLKRHYNLIPLSDYLHAAATGSPLPAKAMVVTFDDGHISNYDLLPILKRHHIPVTIFLCSGIVGTHRHFWFRHSDDVKKQVESLKRRSNEERLQALKTYGFSPTTDYDDIQALQEEHLREMMPVVDFQSHTCFHPILPQCDDKTAQEEIAQSKQQLETHYGLRITTLSYPNGDYSERDIQLANEAGYLCGVTVDSGYNTLRSDLFRLKRFSAGDAKTTAELMVKSSGLYALVKHRLHKPNYGFKATPK